MSLMELMTGLKDLDVEWVNLQYGDVKDDIAAIAAHLGIAIRSIPELDIFHDLEGLMHLIHECDFVVSSSNSTAHFAGALGKSGAVIVPFNKGKLWYWHMNDGPSPWYPSLNIIHCQAQNDWSGAISDVNQLIRKHLGTSH